DNLLLIALPGNELVPVVSIMITAFDVEVSRFEVPHELREHAHLKVPPLHPIRAPYPFSRACEQLPPRIRHPGEIEQFDPLFLRCTLLFDNGSDKPIAPTSLSGT